MNNAKIIEHFKPLFEPRTVAVIGASTKGAALPNIFIRRIREFGYRGDIYPIHPTADQIDRFIAFAGAQIRDGRPVAVHCGAGLGRTGTMLACYLVHLGEGAEEAIASVRRIRPGSIETAAQERCVRDYAARRPPPAAKPRKKGRGRPGA